jgi:hypothetical protein
MIEHTGISTSAEKCDNALMTELWVDIQEWSGINNGNISDLVMAFIIVEFSWSAPCKKPVLKMIVSLYPKSASASSVQPLLLVSKYS